MNCESIYASIVSETRAFFGKAGFEKAVVGLSGGIDSALTAYILADALGKRNVTALLLPDASAGRRQDHADALAVAKQLGISFHEIPIDGAVAAFGHGLKWKQGRVAGMNLRARVRMAFLYNYANSLHALVVGTGNKSELMLGYFTKHGDGAADFMPLRSIFKSSVFELASYRGLPQRLIGKKPSAGLAPGQTDEGELGAPYGRIDPVLKAIAAGKGEAELKRKFEAKLVDSLLERIGANRHKGQCGTC